MAKSIPLRFTKLLDSKGNQVYDSNLIQINGPSGVHLDMSGIGNSVTTMRSLTGTNFVSCHQDYFGEIWDSFIPHPGIGGAYKLRVNNIPVFGIILGDVEDLGDVDPNDPNNLTHAFAGNDGEYFMGKDGQYFFGRNS